MKKFLLLIFLFQSLVLLAQGSINYSVLVKEGRKGPKANVKLVLIEKNTFERLEFVTDAMGKAQITLDHGDQWILHVGNMKNYNMFEVPKSGNSNGSMMITYNEKNWDRITLPPVDRSTLNIKTIHQEGISNKDFDPQNTIVKVTLRSEKGKPWKDIEVALTNYKSLTSYQTKTNGSGVAYLKVPINQNYQLDVDGEPDYDYVDVGPQASIKSKNYKFEKMKYKEELDASGYLVQTFLEDPIATSNRTLVTLKISGEPNGGANEEVFIEQTYSSNKFKTTTDKDGVAQILLPKGKVYIISFPFQPSADVLDLTYFRGISATTKRFVYTPDDRLLNPHNYLPNKNNTVSYNLNRFGNTMADPNSEELVNVTAKWGTKIINSESKEAILELGFTARKPKKSPKKQTVNISFVLDKSGSMGGESFDLLKEEMLKIIDKLNKDDQVSIVFFNDEKNLAYPQSKVIDREILKDIIHTVQPGGGTNIYEGLKLGYEQVMSTFNPDVTNRVILLTDGYGSKPIDYILEQSAKYFDNGISVSAIGVGESYNESLLTMLSKYSGGLLHHVVDKESITSAFSKEFDQLFTPLARELKVTVSYNDQIIYKTLFGIDEVMNGANNEVLFKLPQVYASLDRLALVKFKLNEPNQKIQDKPIIITTSYHDEVSNKDVVLTKEIYLQWTDETDLEQLYDAQIRNLYSVATINQMLKALADLIDNNDYHQAKENISNTLDQLRKTHKNKFSPELQPVIKELETYLESVNYLIKNKTH